MVLLSLRLQLLPAVWVLVADPQIDRTVVNIRTGREYTSFRLLDTLSIRLWAISLSV